MLGPAAGRCLPHGVPQRVERSFCPPHQQVRGIADWWLRFTRFRAASRAACILRRTATGSIGIQRSGGGTWRTAGSGSWCLGARFHV